MATRNNKLANIPSIEILNSEGPILIAYKTTYGFLLLDEDRTDIGILTESDMFRFIEGTRSIRDSRDRVWNYPNTDTGMKVEKEKLLAFISPSYKIEEQLLLEKYSEEFGTFDSDVINRVISILENNPSLISRK